VHKTELLHLSDETTLISCLLTAAHQTKESRGKKTKKPPVTSPKLYNERDSTLLYIAQNTNLDKKRGH
jgi:hypothetical protein